MTACFGCVREYLCKCLRVSASPRLRVTVAFCLLPFAFAHPAFASDVGDFLGRRVTRVEVIIEEAPASNTAEMRNQLEVTAGQDYSPVRIHDSLVRLYRSGLVSAARVEGVADGANGVILRFIVRPQARIDAVVFEGNTIFPAAELRARLNQLDPGERLSPGAVTRGQGDLLAFYSARGYYQTRIVPDMRLNPTGTRAVIAYTITPGDQARVSKFTLDVKGAQIDLSKSGKPAIVERQPFTQAKVQEEMDRARNAYLQQDYLAVRVNQNITPNPETNTVAVTITVDTGPRFTIVVQGYELDDEKKREILPFYRQGGVDEFTLEEGRRRLLDHLQQRGFFFAQINRPNVPDMSRPTARIDYVVDPGFRYRLTNIEIEGLDAIPSATLQKEMRSKEALPIPLFGGRGITSDDMLRQDSNRILRRLRELGYRRAHVDVRRGVSLAGSSLIITFDVQQGPRTYVQEVGIRGNAVMTSDELNERLTVEPGDPFVSSEVNETADQLLSTYNRQGYANAEVLSGLVELGTFDGQDRARLIYDINEGNRIRIRNITTRGTAVTDVGRLEQDFYLFKKGDWLRPDRQQETERQLYDTNAFNSVNITSEPVGETVNDVQEHDVTVNLLEAKQYNLIFGLGYQTNKSPLEVPGLGFLNGARGLIQLTQTNMFGKLYTGSAQIRVSQNELFGNLSFQNPRPFGTKYPTLISLFARRLAERSFRSDRYTASIQAERRLSLDTIVYVSYNFERISISSLPCNQNDPNCTPLILEEVERNSRPIRLGRIGPSFARDKRDNKFDPTTGTQTLGSFFIASKFLGGNEQFVKLLIEQNRHYPIRRFRETVYSVSGRLGLATPFGGAQTLPISERFFGGGARDLRGFGFEEAGPQTTVVVDGQPRQFPLGGNGLLVINNELRFPIWNFLGGAIFADTGNVFRRVRDIKPANITQTLGFGLRLKTPVGPVRFDLGWLVINKPAGVKGFHTHFSIGQTF